MSTDSIRLTLLGVTGAAGGLAGISSAIVAAAAEPTPTPHALKHTASTIQSAAMRAALAALSLTAAAGRLEAYAEQEELTADQRAQQLAAARAEVEAEAVKDARLYLDDNAPGREPAERWAAEAFAGQWEDFWNGPALAVDRERAEAWYVAAFERAVRAGGAS